MTYYIHHIPGRLRIKGPILKHRNGAEKKIVDLLQTLVGIERTAVNVLTGSCLIHYDPSITCRDDIIAGLYREGYFNPREAMTHDEYAQHVAERFLSHLSTLIAFV